MENNNTPRKAVLRYAGTSIPVIVMSEGEWEYKLLLDKGRAKGTTSDTEEVTQKRALYIDALMGYEGANKYYPKFVATVKTLWLHKKNSEVTLVFDEPEIPEGGEPAIKEDPDNLVPRTLDHPLNELDKQLNLMAHLNYKVKSWDISFPEDGEPQLYATFTKVEEVHPF